MGASCTTILGQQRSIRSDISNSEYPKYVPQITHGRVVDVYDGNTITILGYVKQNPEVYRSLDPSNKYCGTSGAKLTCNSVHEKHNSDLIRIPVRLNGINCPENENIVAKFARQYLLDNVYNKLITLHDMSLDKYDRIIAKVMIGDRDIAKELLDKNMAVSYDDGSKICPDDWLIYYLEKNILTKGKFN